MQRQEGTALASVGVSCIGTHRCLNVTVATDICQDTFEADCDDLVKTLSEYISRMDRPYLVIDLRRLSGFPITKLYSLTQVVKDMSDAIGDKISGSFVVIASRSTVTDILEMVLDMVPLRAPLRWVHTAPGAGFESDIMDTLGAEYGSGNCSK